ncbi:2-succinyl-5-enolpyruvyl-6-hydroxy-3-cyclohexene-1-carboxylic-acid synthase [Chryseobacterium arthrosphaerae]|uniref:2-succinyl-5-enolpyruvyl-6-hydroxy-3-cyclohexene-1-carboxylate synthase n=1 Tax=Chryseobacterium arthrosphaerae TaxID=651561 RepID=A0A1B8ZAR9_9FLAO|nr:2-succinyl-5-enolpyruvyl-6-hydroxy-3-cyclohexene-1-carboxylic-acid synthase [Chryseobacterium arthrosphaerae]OCA68670.1 2-succinyl-5-enolpyruvyl-6-hydroxy-3-cyclohexene-1-carboxylic-acid synthase [Chryseobacterium arthrosphaerae]QUY55105.1 2-succinyl-5-enolpyruvyl-6-hydroxy-3-cyclohexene-1-carboxylic-acid synthase [Chryseobacterium arthrosphaerae]RTZ50221.1 2-succinyl-5-enolpyruvyl-6-hydroxy-3-cyclohexene-1-carboxylic-acid synthase [Chryseobacterium arthrosphaerae]UEQ74985.1 2-succinyl-5-eno
MKKYSSKRSIQILAHLLQQYGIADIVISPGSRNAPLAIHFSEVDSFNCYSIVDERSAAFVAMGMAKSEKKPVAVTCTSGSAVVNYYPAVTEAFYQNIPLLILTADRPTDFVDIFDGQTIRQKDVFHQHSYGDFQLLEDSKENAEDINFDIIKKAIELCFEKQGPVHINIPLEEPLYELVSELPTFPTVEKTIKHKEYEIPANLIADWHTSQRIMLLVGTRDYSPELENQLTQLVKNHSVVVLSEANSNLYHEKFFRHIDRYIFNFTEEDYKTYAPDLLITVGQNVVSKKVKQFLRSARPKQHWHLDEVWQPDTYFALTEKIEVKPEVFFSKLLKYINLEPRPYYNLWDVLRDKKDARHEQFLNTVEFSDFYFFNKASQTVPENYNIHFSNSSGIRYAQLFDFGKRKIYCNRGTSGIDGSTSTAMGFAIKNENPTLLITGDLSFFYDINGLWNQYIPPFVRIMIFNNGEGNIFKIIPGPGNANPNTLDEFIATKHRKNAEHLAKHFGFSYIRVEDELTLDRVLENFFKPDAQPKILEVNTYGKNSADVQKAYFNFMKEN